MPQRLDEFNKKFLYTGTNPEGIILAKKDALFFRRGKEFYVNYSGNLDGKWVKLANKTVIIPAPVPTKPIIYKQPYELWVKTTNGFVDQFGDLKPKTGWKFLSYKDVFIGANPTTLTWIFPVPTSTNDTIGNNNSRSYDENYFYAKLSGKWYRTPITTFTANNAAAGAENPSLTTNLPFVDTPRYIPIPSNSNAELAGSLLGVQTYDEEYFYIRVSRWKRTRLNIYYDTNKMTRF